MAKKIPIVDFDCFRLDREEADKDRFHTLVDEVRDALTTVGFMYLINHGIPEEEIQELFAASAKFFNLPNAEKDNFAQKNLDIPSIGGFLGEGTERTSGERIWDLKECFNYSVKGAPDMKWPTTEVPELKATMEDIYTKCIELNNRILDVIGHALQLEDPQYFRKRHSGMGKNNNCSHLRTLFYPAPDFANLKENQIRCGEHTDLGGITLLFQDLAGGLEVLDVEGDWVKATPVERSIVVNIGELMQRWTGNKLVAGVHRVVLPTEPVARQSAAFFGKPDDDAMIVCIDDDEKFSPITGLDYYKQSVKHMFHFENEAREQAAAEH